MYLWVGKGEVALCFSFVKGGVAEVIEIFCLAEWLHNQSFPRGHFPINNILFIFRAVPLRSFRKRRALTNALLCVRARPAYVPLGMSVKWLTWLEMTVPQKCIVFKLCSNVIYNCFALLVFQQTLVLLSANHYPNHHHWDCKNTYGWYTMIMWNAACLLVVFINHFLYKWSHMSFNTLRLCDVISVNIGSGNGL